MTNPKRKPNFSGWATKYGVLCTDGRVISPGAFAHLDGMRVPLVWKHMHDSPLNVLGHAILSAHKDGMRFEGYFNSTEQGTSTKLAVEHGDLDAVSIYANKLRQKGNAVEHGEIRELSLVLAGANPGAKIDNVFIQHGDGEETISEDDIIIFSGEKIEHADEETETSDTNKTVGSILESISDEGKTAIAIVVAANQGGSAASLANSANMSKDDIRAAFAAMSDEQREAAYYFIGEILGDEENLEQSDEEDGDNLMKKNIFDKNKRTTTVEGEDEELTHDDVLTHEDMVNIFANARKSGSLKAAVLAHAGDYGIDNIEYLFPDAYHNPNGEAPVFIQRKMEWVKKFMAGTHHSPMSRIKTLFADISGDEARAKGYVKGNQKLEEVFGLLKRVTTPQTIYKKQKLDKDDIDDITSFDVVAWLRAEMRVMLDEEVARAALLGDGRSVASDDKIKEENIRPIYTDVDLYVIRRTLAANATINNFVDEVVLAKVGYTGSGNLTMFISPTKLAQLLVERDADGHRIYPTVAELKAAMGVNDIVEVQAMTGVERENTVNANGDYLLQAIILDLGDYSFGSDKGGKLSMFDDFDIDFNQYKYLIETRLSGALTLPKSAIIIEQYETVVPEG